jgi:FlaA1/EpsC-like NDP-sugar epimerase
MQVCLLGEEPTGLDNGASTRMYRDEKSVSNCRPNGETGSPAPFASLTVNSRPPFNEASAFTRVLLLLVIYIGAIVLAHWLAYLIRFEFHPPIEEQWRFWRTMRWSLPVELLSLLVFGQFRSLLSYFSLPDARRIVLACGSASAVSFGIWQLTTGQSAEPRSIIILGFVFDTAALGSVRLAFRMLRERQKGSGGTNRPLRRIVIIGAGDVGANLAKEMKLRRDLRMYPIAFFDDDRTKWNTRVHGVPVVGQPELLAEGKIQADEAIIAMPSASGRRIREVVQVFNEVHLRFETVPSMEQMVNGVVKASQIRAVQIEDLLGRERVNLETDRIRDLVLDKAVAVTGAGGSIGSELCRQIAKYHPSRLLLIERCEVQMFQIEQELLEMGLGYQIVPLIADVLDGERMRGIFERFRPQLVFHAAAHKHVPLMEQQPYEAFRNNTIGTKQIAKLSTEFGVERFVLISTDKAINPTNAMGATKRMAELYIQALQLHNGTHTKFMAVRFGNVLGSSGSVIPTFKRQIAGGGPVTVTHPEVTRYFMTVQEAVALVLQSATQGKGGEIFALDMGKLVKIVDVAKQLIELSGLKPEIDIEIKFTGLRPGEKLFEELNYTTENMVPTEHPKIMRFTGEPLPFHALGQGLLDILEKAAHMDANQVKLEIQKLVPEYRPYLTVT